MKSKKLFTSQKLSRRTMLKTLGAGTASLLLGAWNSVPALPPQANKVEIVFNARTGTQGDYFTAQAEKFSKSVDGKISIKLELIPPADYDTKLGALVAGGQLGDAYHTYPFGQMYPFAASGVALALEKIVAADAALKPERFFAAPLDLCKWEGKQYAFPMGAHAGWSTFFVNTDVWTKAGAELPKWEWSYEKEWLPNLVKVQEYLNKTFTDKKCFAYRFDYVAQNALLYIMSWGGDWINSKDPTKATIMDEKTKAGLLFMRDLANKHKVAPKRAEVVANDFVNQFAISMSANFAAYGTVKNTVKDFKWQAFPAPAGPNNTRGSFCGVDYLCVNAKSKSAQQAVDFYKWILFNTDAWRGAIEAGFTPTMVQEFWKEKPMAGDVNFEQLQKWLTATKSWTLPANARVSEFNQAFNSGFESLMNEQNDFNAELKKLQEKVQSVLDKPSL